MLTYDRIGPQDPALYCLILHGLGDSMEGWKSIIPELGLSDIGFLFVNAPEPYFTGYSWFPSIYSGNSSYQDMEAGISRSRELLNQSIEHFMQQYGFDRSQLVLMGFSQGCIMVMDTALRSDAAYAGVLGISGDLPLIQDYPDAFGAAATAHPYLMTHGHFDEVIDLLGTRGRVKQLQDLGVNVDWREYEKAHGVDPYKELPEIKAWFEERKQAQVS